MHSFVHIQRQIVWHRCKISTQRRKEPTMGYCVLCQNHPSVGVATPEDVQSRLMNQRRRRAKLHNGEARGTTSRKTDIHVVHSAPWALALPLSFPPSCADWKIKSVLVIVSVFRVDTSRAFVCRQRISIPNAVINHSKTTDAIKVAVHLRTTLSSLRTILSAHPSLLWRNNRLCDAQGPLRSESIVFTFGV